MRSRLRTMLDRLRPGVRDGAVNLHGVDENREYWDRYASAWDGTFGGFEVTTGRDIDRYQHVGDEWGHPDHVGPVIEAYVYPFLDASSAVLEIGSGGGRIAALVAPRVRHLYCADVSARMLDQLKSALGRAENVSYVLLGDEGLPQSLMDARLDFVYSFDVFVHLDLHTMRKYVDQIAAALRTGGHAFLHTTNLLTEAGWRRFSAQNVPTLEGHFFISPETFGRLVERAGLSIVKESSEDPSNFYAARDYLVVVRK